jgi:hypothetical protein
MRASIAGRNSAKKRVSLQSTTVAAAADAVLTWLDWSLALMAFLNILKKAVL